ncbi:MAG: HNH endonuclease signature motif containing protein [Coleofasciculaceae cyanobacterium]
MPRPYISKELRHLVAERADYICEYCLMAEADRSSLYQIDHIISLKHGGSTAPDNLAYACIYCNLQKGTDLGSINWQNGELVRFFNPRRDCWGEHFRLDKMAIQATTDIGEVTERIFEFNSEDRLIERQTLIEVGRYPSAAAQRRITK